jgi:hypothetical protein
MGGRRSTLAAAPLTSQNRVKIKKNQIFTNATQTPYDSGPA